MRNGLILVLLSSAAFPAAAFAQADTRSPTQGTAQPQSGQIADIVVTAQRRSESLQRVPLAVTALARHAETHATLNAVVAAYRSP